MTLSLRQGSGASPGTPSLGVDNDRGRDAAEGCSFRHNAAFLFCFLVRTASIAETTVSFSNFAAHGWGSIGGEHAV